MEDGVSCGYRRLAWKLAPLLVLALILIWIIGVVLLVGLDDSTLRMTFGWDAVRFTLL